MKEKILIDKYVSKAYKYIIFFITGCCLIASLVVITLKLLGFYSEVSWFTSNIFSATCFTYFVIGCLLIKKSVVNDFFLPQMVSVGKKVLFIILTVQFNFLCWILPSKEFWAYSFLFLIAISFFFDSKLLLMCTLSYVVSLAVVFIGRPSVLPQHGENFIPELSLRIVCITLSFLGIFLANVFVSKFLINAQRSLQQEQVKNIIEKNMEMRRFKHDLEAHVTAIYSYCLDENYVDLKKYIFNMKQDIEKYAMKQFTGNTVIDAIIADIMKSANKIGVEIQWKGILNDNIDIEIYDLSIIFSNIIKNAVEACENLPDSFSRIVNIEVYRYEKKLYVHVFNPIEKEFKINSDNTLESSKEDVLNHGFGSYNVKRVVDQYNGCLQYRCEDNVFHVEILI